MSGYRANVGYGVLTRATGVGPAELPTGMNVYGSSIANSCIHNLTKRFGAGIDISINRNRNNNYKQDIGLREFTVVSSGMLDVDFTINGVFAPSCCDWLQYGIMSEKVTIKSTSTIVDSGGQAITKGVGYVKNGDVVGKTPITYEDFTKYKAMTTRSDKKIGTIEVFYYVNLDGPKYFDIGYEQINKNTTFGGKNEIGVLLGCVIENFSISYESGSDAAITFSISGQAMSNYFTTTDDAFDYNALLDSIPAEIMVGGCVSVYDSNSSKYVAVAQTDSASVTVTNNLTKLGNCLKLYYSSVAMGAQTVEVSTSTYSNNPEKYMSYMYGYDSLTNGTNYSVGKQPRPISKMLISSNNSTAEDNYDVEKATEFINIELTDAYIGTANRTYNVENAIMEEPDIRARKVRLVVGHTSTAGIN